MNQKTCILIGGGATAVFVALELVKMATSRIEILIVEPAKDLGRGLAYSEKAADDLLNVPAEKMSANSENHLEFAEWLRAKFQEDQFKYWPFVNRSHYGTYLQSKIAPFLLDKQVRHIRSRVQSVKSRLNHYELELDDGSKLKGDFLIVCTGYASPKADEKLNEQALNPKNIFVIGSGLSAVDVWRRNQNNAEVRLKFLSRHGLLPLPHLPRSTQVKIPKLQGMSPLQIFQFLSSLKASGKLEWQDIADAVRPQCSFIWSCWTSEEKKQFQRHLKVYWEIIRHRLPQKVFSEIIEAISLKRLEITAGRYIGKKGDLVTYRERGQTHLMNERFDLMVDATGVSVETRLFQNVDRPGGIVLCETQVGFNNISAPRIWIAGPAAKSSLWEITAIAEIKIQAKEIVQEIMLALGDHSPFMMNKFLIHPHKVGETYFQHLWIAAKLAFKTAFIVPKIMVHGILPFFFSRSFSDQTRQLNSKMLRRRRP